MLCSLVSPLDYEDLCSSSSVLPSLRSDSTRFIHIPASAALSSPFCWKPPPQTPPSNRRVSSFCLLFQSEFAVATGHTWWVLTGRDEGFGSLCTEPAFTKGAACVSAADYHCGCLCERRCLPSLQEAFRLLRFLRTDRFWLLNQRHYFRAWSPQTLLKCGGTSYV